MALDVYEWYGYRAEDSSEIAVGSAATGGCPFVPGPCTKPNHTCSVRLSDGETIPVCPKRLYYERHRFAREIAADVFEDFAPNLSGDGLPALVPGDRARAVAEETGNVQVGLFGKEGWSSEIQLPAGVEGGARYSVDYTMVAVDPTGDLLGFVPIEVQTIDTTGSYQPSLAALAAGRSVVTSQKAGMNWENVSKRILPQLITKGLTLQGESLCAKGLFFVTPEPVFQRIMTRLGGLERLRRIPKQPGSITFIRYVHDRERAQDGEVVPMRRLEETTISTSDMSLAFITPQNLAGAGAYERTIRARL